MNLFLNSIIDGFKILGNWEVWVSIIFFIIIILAYKFTSYFCWIKDNEYDDNNTKHIMGCLSQIIEPLLMCFLMSIMILLIFPILLGGNSCTPSDIMVDSLWSLFKIGLLSILLLIGISLMPIIGVIIGQSQGIGLFVTSVFIFRMLFKNMSPYLLESNITFDIFPGFFISILYLVISWVVTKGIIVLFAFIITQFNREDTDNPIGTIIIFTFAPVVGLLGGFLPFYMYCSYVKLSILQQI